jgi:hypothetical protein
LQPVESAAPAAPAQASSPEDVLKSALSGEVDSAAFDAKLVFSGGGQSAEVGLSGAFERGAANDVPAMDLRAKVEALGESFRGGFVAVEDKAYFTQGDDAWQVPAEAWDPVVQAVANGSGAQQSLPFDVHPQTWVENVKSEGKETLDGVETTHVSASVAVEPLVRDLAQATGGNVGPIPGAKQLSKVVERAELDAWVGEDDVVRRLKADLAFKAGSTDRPSSKLSFELNLTGVNKAQRIEAPQKARQGLPGGAFGDFVRGFVTGLSGVTGGEPISLAAITTKNPGRAARAVKAHKKVVIFFRNPRGLDDRVVRRAVNAVDRHTKAVVLTDHVDAVERYGKLVEDVGVSQAPSIVIIDRSGEARLIEGYVDSGSLTQAVADAQ